MTKRSRKPQPLAPPPQSSALRSRKRARQVTTLFHKYTQERDAALARGTSNDEVKKWNDKLAKIGGREEYQRASQLNTSLFSTSKWVLGILGRWGWLDGLPATSDKHIVCDDDDDDDDCNKDEEEDFNNMHRRKKENEKKIEKARRRRDVRLLEVGAINTQLIEAAARTRVRTNHHGDNNNNSLQSDPIIERVHRLDVTAIDIRSTDTRIQQINFFNLPPPSKPESRYDVIVNSMVINCVTTPELRGKMLLLCFQHLRPGGVCFLTLPKLCLIQSKYMSRFYFEEILTCGVGFEIVTEVGRESPKIAFYVLRRPKNEIENNQHETHTREWDRKFACLTVLHRAKKFRNTFAVILSDESV
jgi:25S rRNA (adenine2142-N1)-methyltransferase